MYQPRKKSHGVKNVDQQKTGYRLNRSCLQQYSKHNLFKACFAWFTSEKLVQSTREAFSLREKNSNNERKIPTTGEKNFDTRMKIIIRGAKFWQQENGHHRGKILTTEQEYINTRNTSQKTIAIHNIISLYDQIILHFFYRLLYCFNAILQVI